MQVQEAITAFCIGEGISVDSACVYGISIEGYRLIFANRSEAIFTRGVIDC